MSLRDTILQSDDLEESTMTIPEWGDATITVKAMTGRQRMKLVEQTQAKNRENFYADILIALTFDPETGEPVFDPADRDTLSGKSGAVLERLAEEAMRISGISSDDAEDAIKQDPTSGGALNSPND